MKGTIRIYACGGAGINQSKPFLTTGDLPGFAKISTCFIDTSLSNISQGVKVDVKEEDIFILEGRDGSGKLRSENYEEIAKNIKPILHKFKPEDLNIVVSSASGGSGNIVQALLVKELLEKEIPVIAIVTGSEESKISIENTVKTLQSLDSISRKVGRPILMSYYHNSKEMPRVENDKEIAKTITALSVLCSRENTELDKADVANFIGFHRVTSAKEGLTFLYVTSNEQELTNIEYPISMASIFSEYGKTSTTLQPEYAAVGYAAEKVLNGGDLHFVTSQHEIAGIYSKLSKCLDGFRESANARINTSSLATESDDNGLVL